MQTTEKAETLQLKILLIALIVVVAVFLILLAVIVTPAMQNAQLKTTEPPAPTYAPLDANPYAPEDFEEVDGYLACITGPYSIGIDVSEYQGSIDWQKVKNAGIEFVFIRLGGRGWGAEGNLYADGGAQKYYEGAKAAGLEVGAYFFSQALTVKEAMEEAVYALSLMEGWELDLPLVYDWEYVGSYARTAFMQPRMLTDCSLAFCNIVQTAGVEAMVYFNPSQGEDLLYLEELAAYPFWLAMYEAPMNYPYEVEYWQYTDSGSVPGIYGKVDINLRLPKRTME